MEPAEEAQESAQITTIEITFRDYGRDADFKAEELEAAFGGVGEIRLVPVTPPMAGTLYTLWIVLSFVGKVFVQEILKVGGRQFFERLRDGYQKLSDTPRLREAGFAPTLTVFYDDVSFVLPRPDFTIVPEVFVFVADHLRTPPLSAWRVHSVLFNLERSVTGGWIYDPWSPTVGDDGPGRYWAVAISLDDPAPDRYTHVYDSREKTIVEWNREDHLPPPPSKLR